MKTEIPWVKPEIVQTFDRLWTLINEQPTGFRGQIDESIAEVLRLLNGASLDDAVFIHTELGAYKEFWERHVLGKSDGKPTH